MLYYQVTPAADNRRISKDFDILIGRELYTPCEYAHKLVQFADMCGVTAHAADDVPRAIADLFRRNFNAVQVSRKNIFWSFGARFAADENIREV